MPPTTTETETGTDLVAAAQHALDLVGEDPRRALEEADAVVAARSRPRDPREVRAFAVAQRAAGLALRSLGDPIAAEQRMRRGLVVADRHREVETAAEVRMSLAFVLLDLGRTRAALTLTDQSLAVLRGVKAARARTIRALVLQRSQRLREAFAEYDAALPVLRRARDDDWTARLRHNRALLHIELGETARATDDLEWVRQQDLATGRTVDAADALFNIGVARTLAGDIPQALALFDRAEGEWAGVVRPELDMARAEAMLLAGLPTEAAVHLAAAAEWLHRRNWSRLELQARLSLAVCMLSSRPPDPRRARDEALRAREVLAGPDRVEWEARTLYAVTKAELLTGTGAHTVARAAEIASTLRDMGSDPLAADLRVTAGEAALAQGNLQAARTVLGPLAVQDKARDRDVAGRALFAQSLIAEADGDLTTASRCLRRAWNLVEQQRMLLGATELRAAAASHAESLVTAGLRIAVAASSAGEAFRWGELGRAAVLRYRPVSAPGDPDLAKALASLRWAAAEAEVSDGGPIEATATRRLARREAQVLSLTRRRGGDAAGARPATAHDVAQRLDGSIFLQYVVSSGRLLGVVIGAGRPRLIDVAPIDDVARLLGTVSFGLRRELTGFGTVASRRGGRAEADRRLRELDEVVLGPVRPFLRDDDLVVCPSAALTGLPWSLLPSVTGRVVHVAPSATVWCRARDSGRAPTGRVLAVAGPGLADASAEVHDVVSSYQGGRVLVGEEAAVDSVLAATRSADTWHVAAHGRLRVDNPLFSSLEMADGPLTGYHLESLSQVPATIVLSACSAGAGHAAVAEETLGLAWILMGLGATTVVAPLLPIPDTTTRPIMSDLHRRMAAGASAAEALAAVTADATADQAVVAGSFVAYGA